jgi:hypothetical protein
MLKQFWIGWSKHVASNMWTMISLVSTSNVNGCGEFGNCLTLKYVALCNYLGRWLLSSSLYIQVKKLCVHVANNIDYIGCDYIMCHFTCAEGLTF